MLRFSLHRRGQIYCAQLRNPITGTFTTAKSTGTTDRHEAEEIVYRWLREGIPTGRKRKLRPVSETFTPEAMMSYLQSAPLTSEQVARILAVLEDRRLARGVVLAKPGSEPFLDFLLRFWDYDQSPYVEEKRTHCHRIGRRRCYDASRSVWGHWAPFFQGWLLGEVTKQSLKEFSMFLHRKGLAPKTINNILQAGTVALGWAARNDRIPSNPAEGLTKFSGTPRKGGVLTLEEAGRLFSLTWDDERSRVANLLAMATGLRAGEVLALRVQDIGEKKISVRHSWSYADGLKSTKTNEERIVPFVSGARPALLSLIDDNPWGRGDNVFVFYSTLRDRPMDFHILRNGLYKALVQIGNPRAVNSKCSARISYERRVGGMRGIRENKRPTN
jgi:integrase